MARTRNPVFILALLALLFVTGLRGARAQLADAAFGVGDLEIDDSAAGADAEDADGQVMERNNGGGSGGFAVGETCCKGCSYESPCCCQAHRSAAAGKAAAKVTKTRWVTVTKRRAAPGKGRRDEIPRVQEPAEGQQVSKVGRKLEKRNLCPVCPSNFNSAKASLLRRTYDSSSPVEYCCPAYVKPSGNTIYITKTRTRTINQPGNVKGSETTSAMKQRPTKAPVDKTVINVARTTKSVKKTFAGGSRPVYTKKGNLQSSSLHIGLIYNDYDNDGKYDPGVDTALAKQWVALSIVLDEKNNTFLGRAQTDNEGRFYYMATSAYSRANLSALVVLPGGNVFSFNSITDTMGNSKTMLAVPPPALNIVLFYDRDGNGVQAATETGAANQKVNIRYSDGTLWQTGISSTNGTIKIMYKPRLAYLPIVVETADGKIKKEVALDGDGELFATLALPPDPNAPPETPSVQSKPGGIIVPWYPA